MKCNKTVVIRLIGYLYISVLSVGTILLNKADIEQSILSNGLLAIISVFMAGYGVNYKNITLKKRIINILITLAYGGIMYYFWTI